MVEASGLRGRGGGGFPTGTKWKFARKPPADEQKYLICNADEGDPGAFMDRAVIESDPHRLLEGMAIAAYAIGASKAYIYIRAEYPLAIKRLKAAIAQAEAKRLIGEHILGSSFSLKVIIKMGAGAFVCGEETALINSIEGSRGMPRPRPPFPAVSGLFGKPTIINNVETLANLPALADRGAAWFSAVGTKTSKGTKVFALSGKVSRTGLVEVAMGTRMRNIIFDIGGGIPNGKAYKAVQIGGPSGGCIPTQHLDIDIDYESLKTVGAMMGSGGLVVMDEETCMVDVAKFFMDFIQRESCGKCIPCREGTRRMLEILQRITRGRRKERGIEALERFQSVLHLQNLAESIRDTSLCGLGQTAPNPVLSTLRWFRDEYEAHIYDRHCPAAACAELVTYSIDAEKCKGCTLCLKKCPAERDRRRAEDRRTTSLSRSASVAAVASTPAARTPLRKYEQHQFGVRRFIAAFRPFYGLSLVKTAEPALSGYRKTMKAAINRRTPNEERRQWNDQHRSQRTPGLGRKRRDAADRAAAGRHQSAHALPHRRPHAHRGLPDVRGRGRRPARPGAKLRLSRGRRHEGPHPLAPRGPGPQDDHRTAAGQPSRRLPVLRPQRQLRVAGSWPRNWASAAAALPATARGTRSTPRAPRSSAIRPSASSAASACGSAKRSSTSRPSTSSAAARGRRSAPPSTRA